VGDAVLLARLGVMSPATQSVRAEIDVSPMLTRKERSPWYGPMVGSSLFGGGRIPGNDAVGLSGGTGRRTKSRNRRAKDVVDDVVVLPHIPATIRSK